MNIENTSKLIKRFPLLYRGYFGSIMSSSMPFGFQHSNGWFQIIWQLSLAIEEELKKEYPWYMIKWGHIISYFIAKYNYLVWNISKSLFGNDNAYGLENKLYYLLRINKWENPFQVTTVKEKYGTLSFYTGWETDGIGDYIRLAEELSSHTCEMCGAYGILRGKGWYYTSCAKCSKDGDLTTEEQDRIAEDKTLNIGAK